jgi:hypothetical protein
MINPWVMGQLADQHLVELRASAARSRRVRRTTSGPGAVERLFATRLRWPARHAIGCQA